MPASAPATAAVEPPALLRIPLSSDAVAVASTALPPVDAFDFVFGRTEPLRPASGGEAAVMVVLNPDAHPAAVEHAQARAAIEAKRAEVAAQRRAALAAREETEAQRRAAAVAKKGKAAAPALSPEAARKARVAQLSAEKAEREASRQRYNAELRAWRNGDSSAAEREAAREAARQAWLPLLYDAADAAASEAAEAGLNQEAEVKRWRDRTGAPASERPPAKAPQPHARALRGAESVVAQRRAMETLAKKGKKYEFLGAHPDPCGWQTRADRPLPLPLFPPHMLGGAETLPPAEAQLRVRDARLSGRYFTGF